MRSLVIYEDGEVLNFGPLVWWRTVFELPIGRHILLDYIAQQLRQPVSGVWTRALLAGVAEQRCGAPVNRPLPADSLLVNGRWIPDGHPNFGDKPGVGLVGDEIAYVVCDEETARRLTPTVMQSPADTAAVLRRLPQTTTGGRMVRHPWDLVSRLADQLSRDFHPSDAVVETNFEVPRTGVDSSRLHVGTQTRIHPTATLDTSTGPIYLSHDVTVGAQAVIEGPVYVGAGTRLNPHSWIHGGNSIGPVCRIGGELHGCVICGYTNKHHFGYFGHSFVGSWVNLGAGSCNSDLKNTYGTVRAPVRGNEVDTGEQFFGVVIGDHAKIGINTTIPTGASIGFSAMVASTRPVPRDVPAFAWITEEGTGLGDPERLLDVATRVMARRNVDMTDAEVELFLELGGLGGGPAAES